MSEFTTKSISISGGPDIEFAFSGSLGFATCAGATLAVVERTEESADMRITAADGTLIADITVRKMPDDENLTVSVMNIGAALLWSHARWVAAQDNAQDNATKRCRPEGHLYTLGEARCACGEQAAPSRSIIESDGTATRIVLNEEERA